MYATLLQQMETLYWVANFKIITTLTSVLADVPYITLPALLGGGTTRFPRKRLMVFGFGGSLEHGDGEQDAHKGETPQNHDQCHTAAGLVTVPRPTGSEAAPSFFVRSVILLSKSGELGRHFPPPVQHLHERFFQSESGEVRFRGHNECLYRQLSLESERQRSLTL